MRNLKLSTATAAGLFCACLIATGNAKATNYLYGAGSAFASSNYRGMMDEWNLPMVPSTICGAPDWQTQGLQTDRAAQFDNLAEAAIFYAAVGIGQEKQALLNHNSGSVATGLGTATPALPPPYTFASSCTASPDWASLNGTGGYPTIHFVATDDPLTADDIAAYNANGGPANWGKLIQFPTFIAAVGLAYNATGLTRLDPDIAEPPGLNLTRQQFCGIMSGHITNWADPIFATSGFNGGPLTTTSLPLTVVHVANAGAETRILTEGLKAQCSGIAGPNNAYAGDNTPALWEMAWTDRTVSAATCPAIPSRGANLINWPDYGTDQCGGAIPNPGGGIFVSAATREQAACAIALNPGAIGYLLPGYFRSWLGAWLKPDPAPMTDCAGTPSVAHPPVAFLQNRYQVDNPDFCPPTLSCFFVAPGPNTVPSPFLPSNNVPHEAIANPLNWTTQSKFPNPPGVNDYPFVGFSWIDLYQCYDQNTPAGNVLGTLEGFLQFYYGGYQTGQSDQRLLESVDNGMGFLPAAWSDAVALLLISSSARLGVGGSGVCTGIPGA